MEAQILHDLHNLISSKGQFSSETTDALAITASSFLKQVVVDLQSNQKPGEKIRPCDIATVLQNLKFKKMFINQHQKMFTDYLSEQKAIKLRVLRDAGYGATNEHVQFIQRVLECPHRTYEHDDTQTNEESESYVSD